MDWEFIVAGIILCIILYKTVFEETLQEKIYREQHLLELAQAFIKIKEKAINNILSSEDENLYHIAEQCIVTSAALRIVYDIVFEDDSFQHHISLSNDIEILSSEIASDLMIYITKILQLEKFDFEFTRSNRGIYHLHIILDEKNHKRYIQTSLNIPEIDDLSSLFPNAQQSRYMQALTPIKVDFLKLGNTYLRQGNIELAAEAFEKAKDENPEDYLAYFGLALIEDEGGLKSMLKYIVKGVELCEKEGLDPESYNIEHIMELGRIYYQEGKGDCAVEAIIEMGTAPENITSNFAPAMTHRQKIFQESARILEKVRNIEEE